MNDQLKKGNTRTDVLEKLEKGKIGHRAAMDWLNVKTRWRRSTWTAPLKAGDIGFHPVARHCLVQLLQRLLPVRFSKNQVKRYSR
jgi:hypothetical protein